MIGAGDGPFPDSDPDLYAVDADELDRRAESGRDLETGHFFANAAEADEWLEFDDLTIERERKCGEEREKYDEWQRWSDAADRCCNTGLVDVKHLDQVEPAEVPRLRYHLKCSIGSVPGAEYATGDMGYTDDLELALWHSGHSSSPYWDVYDVIDEQWAGGASEPSPEAQVRMSIERLIKELTAPWEIYQEGRPGMDQIKTEAEWRAQYPGWRPAPEAVVAPLRVALYAAMGIERAAWESPPPPGSLASYPDGRDLLSGWYELDFKERSVLAYVPYERVLKVLAERAQKAQEDLA